MLMADIGLPREENISRYESLYETLSASNQKSLGQCYSSNFLLKQTSKLSVYAYQTEYMYI